MTEKAEIMRVLRSSPGDLVRSYFKLREAVALRVDPQRAPVPTLRGADVAAVYYQVRVAGDFYEFLRAGPSRVLFGLLDLAGRREDTREILTATQSVFRTRVPKLFAGEDLNEAETIIELCHEIRTGIVSDYSGGRPAIYGGSAHSQRCDRAGADPRCIT